jgi:hypothetical protein
MCCCLILVAGLAAEAAAEPRPQVVPTADAPIRIERCAVIGRAESRDPFNALPENYVSGIAIRFASLRAAPATLVRFRVRYEGSSDTVVERGTFTANVPIQRVFPSFSGSFIDGDTASCTALSATFGDGSAWSSEP